MGLNATTLTYTERERERNVKQGIVSPYSAQCHAVNYKYFMLFFYTYICIMLPLQVVLWEVILFNGERVREGENIIDRQ
jgi:hypothetical protein